VLELHGWGELGKELHAMSRTDDPDRWGKMGDAIDDEVGRLQFYAPYPHDTSMWSPIIADMATP
jgi:hypothetical protein